MLHGYTKLQELQRQTQKKVKRKYVLQLTTLTYGRHKRQGQKHRFKIGDIRPWKQEERAWNTNGGKGFNKGLKWSREELKNPILITEVITRAMTLKLHRSVVSTHILKGEDLKVWFVKYWKAGRSASFSIYHSNPVSDETRLNLSCFITSCFPSSHIQTPFVITNTRLNGGLE